MKKPIKFLSLICAALPLVGTLSSCSGEDYDVLISFWHTFGSGIQNIVTEQAEAFQALIQEHDNIKVKIAFTNKGNYDDIKKNVSQGFASGNVPTITVAYPDHVANYLASETNDGDHVVNLETLYNDEAIGMGKEEWLGEAPAHTADDIDEAFLDEGTHYAKEGTYSLPFLKSSEVLFFNKDAVQRAIVKKEGALTKSPEDYLSAMSWDEFMDFNRYIKDNKEEILPGLVTPTFYDSDANLFVTKMAQNEIPFSSVVTDKDGNKVGNVDFDSKFNANNYALAKEMVMKLKGLRDEGLLTTKAVEGKYGSKFFTTTKSMFSIGSTGGTGYVTPQGNAFQLGCVKVPADNDNPLYVSQGPCLTILKNPSDNSETTDLKVNYAWKFVKYLLNPENNTLICTRGSEGYIPVRKSAYATAEWDEFIKFGEAKAEPCKIMLSEIKGNYLNTEVFPGSSELRDSCGNIITQALQSTKKGDDLSADIDRIFTEQIAAAKLAM